MSIEDTIAVGEKAAKELAAKKEADRIAKLTPEQKTQEEQKAKEAAKLAEDSKLLEAKDEELDDAKKARKAEIIEANKKKEADEQKRILEAKDDELSEEERTKKSALLIKAREDKEAEREAKIQARIDEIAGELKAERALRAKDQEKIAALEAEQKKLKAVSEKPQIESQILKLEQERVSKYLESDKEKPRSERREMDDAELEEWMLEDMVGANRWLAKQEHRRERERAADEAKLRNKNDEIPDDAKTKAEIIIKKQAESKQKAQQSHPEIIKLMDRINSRASELSKNGVSNEEAGKIILKEIPNASIFADVIREKSDDFLLAENGPELLVEEISKRMKSPAKKGETQEEREKRIEREAAEAERQRQAEIDENLKSTHGKGGDGSVTLTDDEKKQFEVFRKANPKKTLADFKANLERRKKNGA